MTQKEYHQEKKKMNFLFLLVLVLLLLLLLLLLIILVVLVLLLLLLTLLFVAQSLLFLLFFSLSFAMAETPLTVLRRDLDRLAKRQRAGAAKVAADVDELRRELAAARDAMLRAAEGT